MRRFYLLRSPPPNLLSVGRYNHSGTSQSWYDVLDPAKTYTFEVWLRGTGKLKVIARRQNEHTNLELTKQWKLHSFDFTVPELYEDSKTRRIDLLISGDGKINIDNLRIYQKDAPYLGLLPDDKTSLKKSGMSYLRTHGFVKTFQKTYDLTQLTNPAGVTSSTHGNTLPQTLSAFMDVGIKPWLQIEPHFTKDEWLGLIEFIAAPYTPSTSSQNEKPWAAKRYYSGQKLPYTDVFNNIRFEIGNETWNRLFSPWTFPIMKDGVTNEHYSSGDTYGLYQRYVLSIFRESPYWDRLQNKLEPVLGGWNIKSYGQEAASKTPLTPLLTIAEYNGGWDQGEGVVTDTPEGYSSLLSFAAQTASSRAVKHITKATQIAEQRGTHLSVGTYEAGPGYARNGLNNAKVSKALYEEQEQVMKSVAAGTATVDTFLTLTRAGYITQNLFLFQRGDYWSSHAKWYLGGHPYPTWQWLTLLNNNGEGLGDLLKTKSENIPTRDVPAIARRKALDNMPMLDIYPFLNNKILTIVVISRFSEKRNQALKTTVILLLEFRMKKRN